MREYNDSQSETTMLLCMFGVLLFVFGLGLFLGMRISEGRMKHPERYDEPQ